MVGRIVAWLPGNPKIDTSQPLFCYVDTLSPQLKSSLLSREEEEERRHRRLLNSFRRMPANPNQACVVFLVEHLVRVAQLEQQNKEAATNIDGQGISVSCWLLHKIVQLTMWLSSWAW